VELDKVVLRLAGTAKALAIFGASRIVILMGFAFSATYVKPNTGPGIWNIVAPWWRYLLRFDSAYYLDIAAYGYRYNGNPQEMQNIVFFPGYPILFHVAARILPISLPFSAVFVSNLCAAGAIVLLFRLVARRWNEDTAFFTVAAVSFFPASLFLSAAYAEGAGLLFTVAAFYFLFRGRIALAAACAGCSSGIRPLGFLLAIPLIYAVWRDTGRRLSMRFLGYASAAGAAAVSGLMGFMLHCWFKFHDPLVFVHARAAWKGEGGLPPGHAAWQQLTAGIDVHYLPSYSDAWFFPVFAGIAIVLWKRLPLELNLYTASAFVALLATRVFQEQGFISMNRYLLLLFPCMIGMALIAARRAWLMVLVGGVLGAMLFMHAALFAQWYWAG
jgi:hypothetical protein